MRLRVRSAVLLLLSLLIGRGSEAGEGAQNAQPVTFNLKEGLLKQRSVALETLGESLTIMCVGESGVGKTTLLSNIFARQMGGQATSRRRRSDEPTNYISERVYRFTIEGLPFTVRLIDTPGYGDSANLSKAFHRVVKFLERRFQKALKSEASPDRLRTQAEHEATNGVDALLYFFAPHRCKGADIAYLRAVQDHAPIIPILAKADTMTSEELSRFRKLVVEKLRAARVRTFCSPFAIISSPLEPVAVNITSSRNSTGRPSVNETQALKADVKPGNRTSADAPSLPKPPANQTRAADTLNRTHSPPDPRATLEPNRSWSRSVAGARSGYRKVRIGGSARSAANGSSTAGNATRWFPSKGRIYHWGIAEPENPLHSDLSRLRSFLLFERLEDLHYAKVQCYERFRRRRLHTRRTLLQMTLPCLLVCAAILPKITDEGVQERLEYFLPIFAPLIRLTSYATRHLGMLLRQASKFARFVGASAAKLKWSTVPRRIETTPRAARSSKRYGEASRPQGREGDGDGSELSDSGGESGASDNDAAGDDRGARDGPYASGREKGGSFFSDRLDYDEDDWEGTDVRALQQAQLREQGKMKEDTQPVPSARNRDGEGKYDFDSRDRASAGRGAQEAPMPASSGQQAPYEMGSSDQMDDDQLDRSLTA